jgi:hypothetical protein
VMKGTRGCPAWRLRGQGLLSCSRVAGRSLGRACLYDTGRLEVVDMVVEGGTSTVGGSDVLIRG